MAAKRPLQMSQHVYLANKGKYCPTCFSDDIFPVSIEYEIGKRLTKEMQCNDCEQKWIEYYNLAGYKLQ